MFREKRFHVLPRYGSFHRFLFLLYTQSRLEEDARLSISSEELCDDGSERPVETLKKMLFTVQGLASQDEDEKGSDREIMSEVRIFSCYRMGPYPL